MDADLDAVGEGRVHANIFRRPPAKNSARGRQKIVERIFGIEARFDSVTDGARILRQALAFGDLNL